MRFTIRKGLLVVGLVGTACGGGGSGSNSTPQTVTLEMDTWWDTSSELMPIQSVIALHEKAFPNVTVNVVTATSQETMDTSVTGRFGTGNPPQAFEANPGSNALQFATGALDLSSASWANPSTFPQSVLDTLTQNGKLIGVPLGLTRQNATYWNMQVMGKLAPPLNAIPIGVDNFKTWLAGVVAAGYTHPLCFGFGDSWVAAHILFEDIVPAMEGAKYSTEYWSGLDPNGASSTQIADALTFAAMYVQPYLTSDSGTNTWEQGTERVMVAESDISQQCLMTAMGDWGGAYLETASDAGPAYIAGPPCEADAGTGPDGGPCGDFNASGWPGAETLLDLGGDAMVAAVGTQNQSDVLNLFDTMASEQGQLLFATQKGEMPARILTAADQATLPYLIQLNLKALAQGSSLPGFKLTANANYDIADLYTACVNFWASGNTAPLLSFLAQNYPSLK
jgi:ABC-type glycerol-3-phosphate transport system substrate-binding protein